MATVNTTPADLGAVTGYAIAKERGYNGTLQDWVNLQLNGAAAYTQMTTDVNNALENKIVVGTTTPSSTDSKVWIDTSGTGTVQIPEINDEQVSDVDTWSSQKITDEIKNGTLNQYVKTNPLVKGSSSNLGTMVIIRSNIIVQDNGGVKIERSSDSSTKSYGVYFQFENDESVDRSNHKFYYRLADVDISGATHFTYIVANLTYASTTVTEQRTYDNTLSVIQGILTPKSNANRFVIQLYPGSTVGNGEYYNIGSVQLIDLTEMFGVGYEPSLDNFVDVYGEGMPYQYTKTIVHNELREVKALAANSRTKAISDAFSCDPEERELYRQDVLSCAASYLVNEKNCTCVVGIPTNISSAPFVASYDKTKGYENMYLDTGRDDTKFVYTDTLTYDGSDYPVVYLDCTAFCGLLTKCIPYEESPMYYAFTHLNNIDYDTMFNLGFNNGDFVTKPYTFDLHQYNSVATSQTAFFANHSGNRLCKLWDGTFNDEVFNILETGDILYIGYASGTGYRGIGHVQVFLKTLDELNVYGEAYNVSFKSSEKYEEDPNGAHGYVIEVGNEIDGVDCIRVVSLESWVKKVTPVAVYMHKANATLFNSIKASNCKFKVINHALYL